MQTIPQPGRLLALDMGDKRIGVAMSDELQWTAQPLMTYERRGIEKDILFFKELIKEHDVKKVIVGVPVSLSEKITIQTQKVLDLVVLFKEAWSVPVETWDESLTTKEAHAMLIQANVSRKKRKKVVDKIAAVFILQSYMEAKR